MDAEPSRDQLEAAHCWEADDRVPGRTATTAFRRRARLHQARWRERHGHPIGTQPIVPRPGGKPARPVGSRLPLEHARATGANFVTPGAFAAATARSSYREPHQSWDAQRPWADMLWSTALAFNLFGDLAADVGLADRAVHTWWPDIPGIVRDVRFRHSPGWLDPAYLGNLMSFDTALTLDLGAESAAQAFVAVETRYRERLKLEVPKPARLPRYLEVAERSGVFTPAGLAVVGAAEGSDLLVLWLEHLLVLSMLQHPSGRWRWGRMVVVHPAANADMAEGSARYQEVLVDDDTTFVSVTLEELLDAGALPSATASALRDRYIPVL